MEKEKTATALLEMSCDSLLEDGTCAFVDKEKSACGGKCCLTCSLDNMEKCKGVCNDLKAVATVIGEIAPHLTIWRYTQLEQAEEGQEVYSDTAS